MHVGKLCSLVLNWSRRLTQVVVELHDGRTTDGRVYCVTWSACVRCSSSQSERHRRSSAAVRSHSVAGESSAARRKPRRSSDCTDDDDDDSVSGDRVPLRDDLYGRRADDRDLYDYKVMAVVHTVSIRS